MDKEKYMPMLRAVQEVKAQHYIGSLDAYKYLKDKKRWDDLMNVVREVREKCELPLSDLEIRKLLVGLTEFRSIFICLFLMMLNVKLTKKGALQSIKIPGQSIKISRNPEDIFGNEAEYIRRFFESWGSPVDENLMGRDLIELIHELFLPSLREHFGEHTSDELHINKISKRIIPILLSIVSCMEDQSNPLFPGVQTRYELLSVVLSFFERDPDYNHLNLSVMELFGSDVESTEARKVDNFYPPEKLYRRIEREQIMHDIFLQRECVISWAERYPVNEFSEEHDFDRIRSFEDAVSIIECDIEYAKERLENQKKAFFVVQKEGHVVKELKRNIRAYEFIKTQLLRHRRFFEKFLSA